MRRLSILAAVLGVGMAVSAGTAGAPTGAIVRPDVIRVGGPSAPGDAKVALVMSAASKLTQSFTVVDSNGVLVLSGPLTRATKPAPWRHAAFADLSAVQTPGTYRVQVGALVSRGWVVRESGATDAIATMLEYFAANRDGNEPSPIHAPAHLHDARVASGPHANEAIDLTGGWMDAGDMIHFTETTAYSALLLQLAAELDPADAIALRDEAAVGVRWIVKAHPAANLFIGQVGDERDHDQGFRDPAVDDTSPLPGIGTRLAYPSTGSGLSGKASAALALSAEHATGLTRDLLIAHAEQWYASGVATAGPGPILPGGFYRDTTWRDDLALAATILWRVTGDVAYRAAAVDYLTPTDSSELAWSNVAPLAAADLCGALHHPAPQILAIRDLGCAKLLSAAQNGGDAATVNAPWGTPGYFGWGSTGANGAQGAMVAVAAKRGLVASRRNATNARDWLLGRNPWGASFVAAYGPEAPQHPHHWASVFGSGLPRGAVVGGPAPKAQIRGEGFTATGPFDAGRAAYVDNVNNYVTAEPAIDYTVNSILLLAALV